MGDFQILSLSGGGYKGLYTALVLAAFEEHYKTKTYKHFDLIAGTSIGGIIALALAHGVEARAIARQLLEYGPSIFVPLPAPGRIELKNRVVQKLTKSEFGYDRGFVQPKHSNNVLHDALHSIFDQKTIGDSKTRILVPTANLSTGRAQFFKTQHNSAYFVDGKKRALDVALATSAAPIYFPAYSFDDQIYADGGLVGNNPGLFALDEVESRVQGINAADLNIKLLSIGALASFFSASSEINLNLGLAGWADKLLPLTMSCQEKMAIDVMNIRLANRFHYIDGEMTPRQTDLVSLDNASEVATSTIQALVNNSVRGHTTNEFVASCFLHTAPAPTFYNQ